jgi:hypothetical protein
MGEEIDSLEFGGEILQQQFFFQLLISFQLINVLGIVLSSPKC